MGMINKGLLLEKKFYIEIRETALKKRLSHHRRQHQKNAYYNFVIIASK